LKLPSKWHKLTTKQLQKTFHLSLRAILPVRKTLPSSHLEWMKCMTGGSLLKKRLFVTGLTGFTGQHIQSRLQADASEWELLPVPCPCDLAAPPPLEGLWPELPDAVIHLAGQTFVPDTFRDPAHTLNTNLPGTLNLLRAFKACGFTGTFPYVSLLGARAEHSLPVQNHRMEI
jgi:GDP-4-dehydro-6-deoxy-D-mannose reductase